MAPGLAEAQLLPANVLSLQSADGRRHLLFGEQGIAVQLAATCQDQLSLQRRWLLSH
jgi:hypothetical protein